MQLPPVAFWVSLFVTPMLVTCALTGTSNGPSIESVDAAARAYRIRVYQQYRNNRPEYDRRIEAGRAVIRQWQRQGSKRSEVSRILRWFAEAHRPGHSLPPLPIANTDKPAQQDRLSAQALIRLRSEKADLSDPNLPVAPRISPPADPAQQTVPSRTIKPDWFSNIRSAAARQPQTVSIAAGLEPAPPRPVTDAVSTVSNSHDASRKSPLNIELLDSKIRSTNLSLRGLESELEVDRLWSVNELEAATALLKQRISDRDWAEIYRDSLPPEIKSTIQPAYPIGSLLALLAQRTFELKLELSNETSTNDRRFQRLDRISQQIQRWGRTLEQ